MPITIVRKKNNGISYIRNAMFCKEFPPEEFEFTIPSLSWMVYLCNDFDLIEATDENGNILDLTNIKCCCGSYAKFNVKPKDKINADKIMDDLENPVKGK
jgi:hypothetical protein